MNLFGESTYADHAALILTLAAGTGFL